MSYREKTMIKKLMMRIPLQNLEKLKKERRIIITPRAEERRV